MIINFNIGATGGGGGESDPSKLDVVVFNKFTQDQNVIDESQNEAIENIEDEIKDVKDLPLEKGVGLMSVEQKVADNEAANIVEGQYSIGLGLGGITKQKDSFTYATELNFAYLTGSDTTYTVNKIVTNATVWNIIKDYVDPSILIGSAIMLTSDKTTKHFITNAEKDSSGNIIITVDSTLGSLSNKPAYLATLNASTAASIIGGGLNAGNRSNMLGFQNFCKGNYTSIIGALNIDGNTDTKNGYSTILGYSNANSANYSSLIGYQNKNNSKQSFLIGGANTNNGANNYILGASNTNAASVNNSVTIGVLNTNNGAENIFNLGNANVANGKVNQLFGNYLITNNDLEGAIGTCNVSSSDTKFSIGIGTDSSRRKNGLEIKSDGRVLGQDGKEIAYKELLDELLLFKFPNATIIGEPTIQNGQVSDFSTVSYLQFPFIVDLHNRAFEINFCFTTATNVQTQQNILDSRFGIALAISGGKGLMAISSNGTSWNIGNTTGTMNIEANTTYYAKLTWDGIQYKTALSTNGVDYTQDMVLVGAQAPHPTTIFIGGCNNLETGHDPHPFLGTINLNKANLSISGNIVWEGMDDVGLATRLATDMSNIDEAGEQKIKDVALANTITMDVEFEDGTTESYEIVKK